MNPIETIISLANNRPKEWRYGQAIFNYCYKLYPNIANSLRATEYDCFYNDNNAVIFLEKVADALQIVKINIPIDYSIKGYEYPKV